MHPLLFALYPAISLYRSNVAIVPMSDILLPCAICAALVSIAWVLFAFIFRDSHRGARVASAFAFVFFMFGAVYEAAAAWTPTTANEPAKWVVYAGWAGLLLASVGLAVVKWKDAMKVTTFLNLASALMCLFAIVGIVGSYQAFGREVAKVRAGSSGVTIKEGTYRPDVFYIVLDGFGRDDVLSQKYGVESPLGGQLRQKGFVVAEKARANYVQTELSISSTLNMAYLQDLVDPNLEAGEARLVLDRLIADSEVSRTFKAAGYTTVAVTTGFPALHFSNFDVWIRNRLTRSLFVDALLDRTPLLRSEQAVSSQFDGHREHVLGGFDALNQLAKRGPVPRFIVVHILSPHPPFVFGKNGESKRPRGGYALSDGSHFVPVIGSAEEYRKGYSDQSQYIAGLVVDAIDQIIASNSGSPVIIVQGDHGPKAALDQESIDRTDLEEALPILSAYYGPSDLWDGVSPTTTPVNTFRFLLKRLFAAEIEPVEDRSYYSSWSKPLEFFEAGATRQPD